jgi:hypothetical protein
VLKEGPNSKASKKTLRDDGCEDDLDSYINAYDCSRRSVALSVKSHTPFTLPDLDGFYPSRRGNNNTSDRDQLRQATGAPQQQRAYRDLNNDSMCSEATGQSRNTPEPRQPVKIDLVMPISPPPAAPHLSLHRSGTRTANCASTLLSVDRKESNETLSSVLIAPRPVRQDRDEAVLVDLMDMNGSGSDSYPTTYKPAGYQVPLVTPPPPLPSNPSRCLQVCNNPIRTRRLRRTLWPSNLLCIPPSCSTATAVHTRLGAYADDGVLCRCKWDVADCGA